MIKAKFSGRLVHGFCTGRGRRSIKAREVHVFRAIAGYWRTDMKKKKGGGRKLESWNSS